MALENNVTAHWFPVIICMILTALRTVWYRKHKTDTGNFEKRCIPCVINGEVVLRVIPLVSPSH